VTIAAKRNTTIDFPFSVNYNKDIDPGFAILFDIAQKCGLTGGEKQKLEIDYKLTLTIKILLVTINPSFNRKAMIDCPIKVNLYIFVSFYEKLFSPIIHNCFF
jgi:hypothetical protein